LKEAQVVIEKWRVDLAVYTDGVTETENVDNVEFGESRLMETILAQHHLLFLFNGHSSKRGWSDGENQPDETLLISFGPALVASSLLSRAGEAYDARDRGPNRKSRFKLSVAMKNRSRLAADCSLSVLSLSLLERGGFLERPAAVKGALLLRGEANP
jgi:hypothetical protein